MLLSIQFILPLSFSMSTFIDLPFVNIVNTVDSFSGIAVRFNICILESYIHTYVCVFFNFLQLEYWCSRWHRYFYIALCTLH